MPSDTLPLAESSEDLIHLLEKVSIGAAIGGIVLGLLFYWKGLPKREGWDLAQWSPIRRLVSNQFGYDAAIVSATVDGGAEIATILDRNVDKGLIGGSGIGLGKVSEGIYSLLNKLQSGLVRMYAVSMLVGVIGIALAVIYLGQGGHK